MTQLKLMLLGSPRMERDGQTVEVDTRKAIALMAYLAVTAQSHSRDALATLLWPDYDQAHARAALRRTLSALNKALAGDWLEVDRENIALNPDTAIWVDAVEFQRHLTTCRSHNHPVDIVCGDCVAPLTEAVTLYRDDFMAGFTLRDSPDFDEWQFFQTESLRRDLGRALENLVRCQTGQREFDSAITYARRWLALDPLHEVAHRELMRLYAWAGQRGAALRQYRECVRIFDQELGVPPLEETTQLYEAIQENRLPGPPEAKGDKASSQVPAKRQGSRGAGESLPAFTPAPPLLRSPAALPLVGRYAELTVLVEAYTAITNDGHLIVLEGEAGIGKTRLAEEFLTYVQTQGGVTLRARCYEGETNLAYGPFIEGLRAAVSQADSSGSRLAALPAHWLNETVRLLPELAFLRPGLPPAPPLDNPGAQSHFFEGLHQVLLALTAGTSPGVLLLDDLHWADAASLELLTYLVRRLRGRPLCLLLTWRSEGAQQARLQQVITEARRAGLGTALMLPRLDQAAVAELIQSAPSPLNAQITPDSLSQRLYQETEGLPFFLVEYLAVLSKNTSLASGEDWSMPGGVRGLLQSRLAGVSETGWQLLNTAAVIGRSFEFDTLRAASGRSDEEVVAGLEGLIEQGLVTEVGGERGLSYDFSHEKLRTLVYEQTSLARRRLMHRRVAEALVSGVRSRSDLRGFREAYYAGLVSQIAHHYRLAGQDSEAADYFKQAGEHARALYANAEALAHFRSALALGHPEAAGLHEAIGDLHTLLGEYNAALTAYETAAALLGGEQVVMRGGETGKNLSSPPHPLASSLARVEHKLGDVYHRRGEWELAESYFEAASLILQEAGLTEQSAHLFADWSLTAHHHSQPLRALGLAHQARELAEKSGDKQALAQVHNILGILARSQDDFDLACQHLEQSLNLAKVLGDSSAQIAALNNLALAYSACGRLEQAIQLTETALALCVSRGDRHREAALHNNLADLFHAAGHNEAAMPHLKQAVTIFAEIGAEAGAPQPEIWKLVEW